MGYRTGEALVFTDLCVFRLDQTSRELTVVETMPGITHQQIRDATGFAVTFDADCREISLPVQRHARCPAKPHRPARSASLEFVSAKERGALIAEILAADRAMVERCIAAQRLTHREAEDLVHDKAVARNVRRARLLRRHLHQTRALRIRRAWPSTAMGRSGAAPKPAISCGWPPMAARSSAWAARMAFCLALLSTARGTVLPAI